jgi:hypothetical protein
MSVLDRPALVSASVPGTRRVAALLALALVTSIALLLRRVAPGAAAIVPIGLAGVPGLAVATLMLVLEEEALSKLTKGVLVAVGLILLGALAEPEARLALFSFASLALGVGLALWLAPAARKRPSLPFGLAAPFAVTLAGLSVYAAYLVLVSRDLMTADFMTYRRISIIVARLADAGAWPLLASAAAESIAQDYTWGPALVPGLVLALTQPTSRAIYTFALLVLYAAPALLALAILARDLARRAGLPAYCVGRGPGAILRPRPEAPRSGLGSGLEGPLGAHEPQRHLEHPSRATQGHLRMTSQVSPSQTWSWRDTRREAILLALGIAAVFVAYPAGMAVAARGMPDVGGVVLTVCALRLADRLARLLALRPGHDARVASMTQRVALALALTIFAMFAFRRWYAFAAAGIAIVLAIEVVSIALTRRASFRWKDTLAAAGLGVLALLALSSPVIVDWLPNLSAHDYASTCVAYRKPPDVFLRQLGDWVGLLPALAGLGGATLLCTRSSDRRLLRLTLGSAAIAAALFLRVQTPYIHHLYLIAPAIAAPVAASMMLAFASRPRAALAALAALGAITLSPLAAALNPLGFAPIAGLPRAPRVDLDELQRLKDWVDQRARSDAKVCGLGSSYTFSGQLIGELWQVRPERETALPKIDVKMPDVDEVDGPPTAALKDCAIIIVGEPIQTHLNPDDQQTVVVPSRDMLTGQGIGAKFRRSGEVFHLENGVSAVVFERSALLDDADIVALQARWRAAREALGFDETGRPSRRGR